MSIDYEQLHQQARDHTFLVMRIHNEVFNAATLAFHGRMTREDFVMNCGEVYDNMQSIMAKATVETLAALIAGATLRHEAEPKGQEAPLEPTGQTWLGNPSPHPKDERNYPENGGQEGSLG